MYSIVFVYYIRIIFVFGGILELFVLLECVYLPTYYIIIIVIVSDRV